METTAATGLIEFSPFFVYELIHGTPPVLTTGQGQAISTVHTCTSVLRAKYPQPTSQRWPSQQRLRIKPMLLWQDPKMRGDVMAPI